MPNALQASGELPICPICCDLLGKYGGPSTLPCGHNGCLDCFVHVQSRNAHCPLCRAPFDPQQQLACNHELKDLINMATSVFMDDKTKEEGWEAFPTAKLMTEHYAHEVKSERRNEPLNSLLNFPGSSSPADTPSAPPAYPGLEPSSGSSGIISASSIAGAQHASSSSRLQYHEQYHQHPGLPQSAPSGTQRDILLLEPPQWLPDSYASHCGACQLPFKPLLRLRHHCRLCGKLFCHSCSSKQLLLPPRFKERDPQRVCEMCASLLQPLQPFLVGATAASVQPPVHDALDAISLRSWLNSPWSGSMAEELYKGANILRAFNQAVRIEPEKGVPVQLLAGARGLALLSVVRLGAGWSCTAGTGVVVSRQRNGTWSAPCAAACYGVGWGLQIGGELTDVLLALRTDEAVRAFASGQTLGLGGSVGVALGPLGRSAEASVRVGGIAARGSVIGYSCSKGAFIGVSLEGSVTCARDALNKKFYGYPVTARQLLVDCSVPQPPAAGMLYDSLDGLIERWENRGLLVHNKAAAAAAASSSSCAAAAGVGSSSKAAAISVASKQQHAAASSSSSSHGLQQQQRGLLHGDDVDAFAEEYEVGSPESVAASAPPAPLAALHVFGSTAASSISRGVRAAAAGFGRAGVESRPQQQQQLWPQPPRQAAAAAVAAEQESEEEEEPQYVLEW